MQVVDKVISILMWAIVIRAIASWFPHSRDNPVFRILYDVTDPLLKPFERIQFGGANFTIDISPILAYFTLYLIRIVVMPLLYSAVAGTF